MKRFAATFVCLLAACTTPGTAHSPGGAGAGETSDTPPTNAAPDVEVRTLRFPDGTKQAEETWRAGKLVAWKGWSQNGQPLDGDVCVDAADCEVVIQNVCFRCLPPYEAVTRWRAAQRRISPPPPPEGCEEGPFPCARPPAAPDAVCSAGGCGLSGESP